MCGFEMQFHLGGMFGSYHLWYSIPEFEEKAILDAVHRLAEGVLLVMHTVPSLHHPSNADNSPY